MHLEAQNLATACSNCLPLVVSFRDNTTGNARFAQRNPSKLRRKLNCLAGRGKKSQDALKFIFLGRGLTAELQKRQQLLVDLVFERRAHAVRRARNNFQRGAPDQLGG